MKLRLVNRVPFTGLVDQYAIVDDHDTIRGGFSLAVPADPETPALMMGLHVDDPGHALTWLFKALRENYPQYKRLCGFRATGRKRGHTEWEATGRNWREKK